MGLKDFLTIYIIYFRSYSQYSNIPFFHTGGMNGILFRHKKPVPLGQVRDQLALPKELLEEFEVS